MKFTIKDGVASVSLIDLLDEFGEDGRESLIGYLAIESRVIEAVVDLLIDGRTKEGAWIGHTANDAVERARMRVVSAADKVLHEVAQAMLRDRQTSEANEKVYETWAWKLYHGWPRNGGTSPYGPSRIDRYPWPEGSEVDEVIDRKLAEIRAKIATSTDDHACPCGESDGKPHAHDVQGGA